MLTTTMERNCILLNDLVEDILLRLPVRDLLRWRCVSKEWCALIDTRSFIKKHYLVQYSICKEDGNMPHFVSTPYNAIHVDFLLLYIQQGEVITLNLTADLERDIKAVRTYSPDQFSVNGIICLQCRSKGPSIKKSYLALWNPATREVKIVAYPKAPGLRYSTNFQVCAFGFDPLSNDFKILVEIIVRGRIQTDIYYELYSLNADSWKRIIAEPTGPFSDTDGYLNGVHYFIPYYKEGSDWSHFELESFNFSYDVFKVFNPPPDVKSRVLSYPNWDHMRIMVYKEHLHLALFICHKVREGALFNIEMWVVTQFDDCGIPLSWQHLFSIGTTPTPAKVGMYVKTSLIHGDLVVSYLVPYDNTTYDEIEDYLYNPSTGEFKKLVLNFEFHCGYLESLFPLSKKLK